MNKAITDDMYAALYAPERPDIRTEIDVKTAAKYFRDMNYNVEEYVNPTFYDISRIYYLTDILLYAGHGEYDRVQMEPVGVPNITSEQHTGVYMGSSNITDGQMKLAGLGRKSMSKCRFAMFAACLSAEPNHSTNIAESTYRNGAMLQLVGR